MSKSIRLVVAFECEQTTADEFYDEQPQTKDEWISFLSSAFENQMEFDIKSPDIYVVGDGETKLCLSLDEALDETGWVS